MTVAASTLVGISAAVTAVGAGVSAVGAMQSAAAQSAAASYNAQVAKNNQVLADQAAQTALQQGAVAQQQKAYQEDVLIGQEKAGFAANGIDAGSGTETDILSDTKAAGELDQLTIANNAARESAGYINQGIGYANQAAVDKAIASSTLTGGDLTAVADLTKGATAVANSWYNYTTQSRSAVNDTAA